MLLLLQQNSFLICACALQIYQKWSTLYIILLKEAFPALRNDRPENCAFIKFYVDGAPLSEIINSKVSSLAVQLGRRKNPQDTFNAYQTGSTSRMHFHRMHTLEWASWLWHVNIERILPACVYKQHRYSCCSAFGVSITFKFTALKTDCNRK